MPAVERWIAAKDGFRLHLVDVQPASGARAIVVAGHAMMVDGQSLYRPDRPSLASTLAAHGLRTLVPDLRGHGLSGPTGRHARHSYEDLVSDVGVYVRHARAVGPGLPLVLLGNSLFGHAALAYIGANPSAPVDALVGFAVNIWNRRWTATRTRWVKKLAVIGASAPVTRALGYLPVRKLGLGTCDEPYSYWRSMLTWVPSDRWDGASGDYAAALSRVGQPFLHVVSDGDPLMCHPDDAALYGASLRAREELRLGDGCAIPSLAGLRPGHVEMVTHPRCEPLWNHVAEWISAQLDLPGPWR